MTVIGEIEMTKKTLGFLDDLDPGSEEYRKILGAMREKGPLSKIMGSYENTEDMKESDPDRYVAYLDHKERWGYDTLSTEEAAFRYNHTLSKAEEVKFDTVDGVFYGGQVFRVLEPLYTVLSMTLLAKHGYDVKSLPDEGVCVFAVKAVLCSGIDEDYPKEFELDPNAEESLKVKEAYKEMASKFNNEWKGKPTGGYEVDLTRKVRISKEALQTGVMGPLPT